MGWLIGLKYNPRYALSSINPCRSPPYGVDGSDQPPPSEPAYCSLHAAAAHVRNLHGLTHLPRHLSAPASLYAIPDPNIGCIGFREKKPEGSLAIFASRPVEILGIISVKKIEKGCQSCPTPFHVSRRCKLECVRIHASML